MDRISIRFILDEMLHHKSEAFKTEVYKKVDRIRAIMFDKDDISLEALALIILLEEFNEKESV